MSQSSLEKKNQNDDLRPDMGILLPSIAVILLIAIPSLLYPKASEDIMRAIYQPFAANFGTLYLWFTVFLIGVCLYFACSRYGDVKFGELDEEPEFSLISWVAMIFCSGVAGAVMFWSITEPLWNLISPPQYAEPMSVAAYDWSLAYLLLHWGPNAWCTYFISALPIAYIFYIKKKPLLRISAASEIVIGAKNAKGLFGKCIDVFFILGLMFCTAVTMCLSLPTVAHALSSVFGLDPSFELQLIILGVSSLIAAVSVYMGLGSGIRILSNINITIALAMVIYGGLFGPSAELFNIFTNGISRMVGNYTIMSLWTDPWTPGNFPADWTIFYALFWAGYGPFMGLFIARISRGRTVREIITWGMVGTIAGGCLIHGVFGSYTLWLQHNNILDAVSILKEFGGPAAMIAVLETLPYSDLVLIAYSIFSTIFLATSVDSSCFVIASTATIRMSPGSDPLPWHRAGWAVSQGALALGIIAIGGLEVAKIFGNFSGALMALPVILLTWSWFKIINKNGNYLLCHHVNPDCMPMEQDELV